MIILGMRIEEIPITGMYGTGISLLQSIVSSVSVICQNSVFNPSLVLRR